jgi:hypothetical protein
VQSALTKGKVRLYTDNEAVARWLQKTIESLLYPAFADANLAVELAEFSRSGAATLARANMPARPRSW